MTESEAAEITGLNPRAFPDAEVTYLRCQLGETVIEDVAVRAITGADGKKICDDHLETNVPFFLLKSFGKTWEDAVFNLTDPRK